MITDDLSWPELGNVSRGATRGNQGSKGSLGPPDTEGRCILQLRVQPGVLAVKLNRKSSEWYRILDNEVQNALKETKTYWRKARRRQDYNPRADQDHMELHEWLQQLKDKVMSQLELLMQKGEIQGPPYVMPDHLEFTFMRKFIERQAQGVPHNPRLRNLPRDSLARVPLEEMGDSDTQDARGSVEASEPGSSSWATAARSPISSISGRPLTSSSYGQDPSSSTTSVSTVHGDLASIAKQVEETQSSLRQARTRLEAAKANSHDALNRYTNFLEVERQAQVDVTALEERVDGLLRVFTQRARNTSSISQLSNGQSPPSSSSHYHYNYQDNQQHEVPTSPSSGMSSPTTGFSTISGKNADTSTRHHQYHQRQQQHHQHPPGTVSGSSSTAQSQSVQQQQQQHHHHSHFHSTEQTHGSSGHGSGTGYGMAGRVQSSEGITSSSTSGWTTNGMHESSIARALSPGRKHPRDWDMQQQSHPHTRDYSREREDFPTSLSTQPPPRKRTLQGQVQPQVPPTVATTIAHSNGSISAQPLSAHSSITSPTAPSSSLSTSVSPVGMHGPLPSTAAYSLGQAPNGNIGAATGAPSRPHANVLTATMAHQQQMQHVRSGGGHSAPQ